MKMKKLLSIGAIALTLTTCTSMNVFAATKQEALQKVVYNGLTGGQVIKGVDINIHTEIGQYLSDGFIDETNQFLKDNGIKYNGSNLTITKKDTANGIKNRIGTAIKDMSNKDEAVQAINEYLTTKLDKFKDYDNATLIAEIDYYFNTEKYGNVIVGRNADDAKTVSLEDKNGNVLVQINSSNVEKAKAKLENVKTYDQLVDIITDYYPGAEDFLTGNANN